MQYLSPGVYVEEVPVAPPIAGVGTSTAALIGVATQPPDPLVGDPIVLPGVNVPKLVTNFTEFKDSFGDFHNGNVSLANAVYAFFNNGGTACYVVRVDAIDAGADVTDALLALEAIDEVAIVAIPDALDSGVQQALVDHCTRMEDRFAIVDGQRTDTISVADIKGPLQNSDYAALYFPRIEVSNLNPQDNVANPRLYISPTGPMAGIYARVDGDRGVHKAPANVGVAGALGLELQVSKNQQDLLNPDGINIIRALNGQILVWGARTLGGDGNGVKYVSTRRLLNFMRESIDEGMQFVVFEPNSEALWAQITRTVSAFLTNIWRDGALFGSTPEQAFFVKCDAETNPQSVRDLGQVITEIGVAIVKPAEFVIFRIAQKTSSDG